MTPPFVVFEGCGMWVKIADDFFRHPKAVGVGRDARILFICSICYAGNMRTDGFVPEGALRTLAAECEISNVKSCVSRLVTARLWEVADNGYRIHDYLAWQRSGESTRDISAKRAEAGRRGGKQKASKLLDVCLDVAGDVRKQTSSKPLAESESEIDIHPPTSDVDPLPPPSKPKQNAIKTPVPDDLRAAIPIETWTEIAAEQGMTDSDLFRETAKCADHYRAKAERRADWVATWRNWMRSDFRQPRPNGPPSNRSPGMNGSTLLSIQDLKRRVAAGEANDQNRDGETVYDPVFRVEQRGHQ